MGRPRIKTIDDSQKEIEKETIKKVKRAKIDAASQEKAKLESVEAISEVARTTDSVILGRSEATTPESKEEDSGQARLPDGQARMTKERKPQKPGKAKPRSKKYQEIVKDLDRTKTYPLDEAVDMAKKMSYAKFNATLEAHINTAQTGIRGLVSLPFASGKKLRILVFGKNTETLSSVIPANAGIQLEKSRSELDPRLRGDDTIKFGNDSTIEDISKGKVDFDLIITTPNWMPKLAKVARILGPRGLMPNPKNSTITDDLKKTIESFQAGKTEYKTEPKAPIIHLALGKLNQPNEELVANIKTLLQTLGKTRVRKFTLSPTMGPGVKVDLSSF